MRLLSLFKDGSFDALNTTIVTKFFKIVFILVLVILNVVALVNSFAASAEAQPVKKTAPASLPEAQTLVLPSLLKF